MGCSVSPPRCGCLRVPTQGEHLLIYVCFMDLRLSRVKKTFERVSEIAVKCGGPSCRCRGISQVYLSPFLVPVFTRRSIVSHTHTRVRSSTMPRCWRIGIDRIRILSRQTDRIFFVSFFFFFIFSDRFISITFEQTWIIYIYVIYMYVYILKKIQVAKLNRKQAPPPKILLIVSYMWDVCTSESIINWEEKKKKKEAEININNLKKQDVTKDIMIPR